MISALARSRRSIGDSSKKIWAIALDPGAAVRATVYSTIPAVIVAYGFYFFAPGFMN